MNLTLANLRIGEAPDRATGTPQSAAFAATRGLDRMIWAMVAGTAGTVLLATMTSGFQVMWSTFLFPAGVGMALFALAWLYCRRDLRIAAALGGTAQLIAFSSVGAPLSYVAASLGWPLQDALFDAADRALGFDWPAMLAWMNAHPALHSACKLAYLSFTPQATITVLALGFSARYTRLRVFLLAFMLAALVTIAISALLPAQGVWGHHALSAAEYPAIIPATRELHLPVFSGLRDGSFRLLMAAGSDGIITFPSLHSALGVIFILALWPVPVLRWAALVVNLLMIAATPIDGGHYFIDILAGVVIAFACWAAAQSLAAIVASQPATPSPSLLAPSR
jgi:membrane-associated phospholipid phosphatase